MEPSSDGSGVDRRVLPVFAAGSFMPPDRVSAFDERVLRDTAWEPHAHATHELLWNEVGVSTVGVGNRVWTITPVLGVWMPAGVVHAATAAAGTWYRTNHFDVTRVPSLSEGVAVVEMTPLLRLLLLRLADAGLSEQSRRVTEAMVIDVLEPSGRELTVVVPDSALLAPIVAALRRDPADRRSLADWAAELGVSSRTVSRAFGAETGLSFARWVTALRVQDAIYLLGSGAELEDVAARVGYASVSAFGAACKRVTGVPPGAFRDVRFATSND